MGKYSAGHGRIGRIARMPAPYFSDNNRNLSASLLKKDKIHDVHGFTPPGGERNVNDWINAWTDTTETGAEFRECMEKSVVTSAVSLGGLSAGPQSAALYGTPMGWATVGALFSMGGVGFLHQKQGSELAERCMTSYENSLGH
jgi:hypothetical protein